MINLLLNYDFIKDKDFLPHLNKVFDNNVKVKLTGKTPELITELELAAKSINTNKILVSNPKTIEKLTTAKGSQYDFSGSMITRNGFEYLFLNPVEQLNTVTYGKFLYKRYITKFTTPDKWLKLPRFSWELFSANQFDEYEKYFEQCDFIAFDIETGHEADKAILCCAFTGIKFKDGGFTQATLVIPFDDMFKITCAKKILQNNVPKCTQNGKYDNIYMLRYNIKVCNWVYDTLDMFHSWYCELPKRLDFLTGFMLREWSFWKSENVVDLFMYNAKDSFATAMVWLALVREIPKYAFNNYYMKFPLNFPCLMTEARGLKLDKVAMSEEENKLNKSTEKQLEQIRTMCASTNFNPGSWQQLEKLFSILGCQDIQGTGKISRDKAAFRHPINKRILKAIGKYKEDTKLISSYVRDYHPKEKTTKSWNGRIFYALNPSATDTGRLASTTSAFWCGLNIQTIPRDRKDIQVKRIFVADEGFYYGEADYEQAEARDVAYLSGDKRLIATVDDETKDFHGTNASAFFGVAYDKIVNSYKDEKTQYWVHDTIDKELRDLSKRTNHGSNYNMGAHVLLDTMGIENVIRAKKLLKLPGNWTLFSVCDYLLQTYAKTYPVVKGDYYKHIIDVAINIKLLTGPTGWTRYCFGRPDRNKQDLNALVAHPSQSLNAMTLNKAYIKVFKEVALKEPKDFILCPQIHDSILFQYRIGREDLAYKVKHLMVIPTPVKDTYGITRTLTVPVALKGNANRWSDIKPMHELAA